MATCCSATAAVAIVGTGVSVLMLWWGRDGFGGCMGLVVIMGVRAVHVCLGVCLGVVGTGVRVRVTLCSISTVCVVGCGVCAT